MANMHVEKGRRAGHCEDLEAAELCMLTSELLGWGGLAVKQSCELFLAFWDVQDFIGTLVQWSPTLGLQIFLDFNSQKSWPGEVAVKTSGSCSPRTSGGPRLGTTTALDEILEWIWVYMCWTQEHVPIRILYLFKKQQQLFGTKSKKTTSVGCSWGYMNMLS